MPAKKTPEKKVTKLQPATREEIEELVGGSIDEEDEDLEEEYEEDDEEGNYIEQDLSRREKERVSEKRQQRRDQREQRKEEVLKAVGRRPQVEREPEREVQKVAKKKPLRKQTQPARKSDGHYYRSWNDIRLEGKVKNEVEMSFTPQGTAVTKFTLQVYQGKEKMPAFIQVTCWEDLAEKVNEDIIEGARVKVLGCLNQYKSKEGRYYTGVTADVVEEIEEYEN